MLAWCEPWKSKPPGLVLDFAFVGQGEPDLRAARVGRSSETGWPWSLTVTESKGKGPGPHLLCDLQLIQIGRRTIACLSGT